MPPISLLELGRVREGSDRRTALDDARALACAAESWGYRRIWVAEHHNMPIVTTAATSLVIAHLAAATRTIRVGAGGIMLPNHAPYVIAEQFGTLETLFPDASISASAARRAPISSPCARCAAIRRRPITSRRTC